jgi:hypothetical protein
MNISSLFNAYVYPWYQISHALHLFKVLRLFFLTNFPGSMFIPCPTSIPDSRVSTLVSGIIVGPRLINFGFFSRPYSLSKGPTFIEVWKEFFPWPTDIFKFDVVFFQHNLAHFVLFSRPYAYSF